jgi:fluoride exporter
MQRFVWICVAGALGSGARYLVAVWAGKTLGATFPWGTLFVNLAGCFLIALVMYAGIEKALLGPNLRFALATGFLGGLTTYSSFNYETIELIRSRALKLVAINVGLTTIGCFVAGLCGLMLARRIFGS